MHLPEFKFVTLLLNSKMKGNSDCQHLTGEMFRTPDLSL